MRKRGMLFSHVYEVAVRMPAPDFSKSTRLEFTSMSLKVQSFSLVYGTEHNTLEFSRRCCCVGSMARRNISCMTTQQRQPPKFTRRPCIFCLVLRPSRPPLPSKHLRTWSKQPPYLACTRQGPRSQLAKPEPPM